MAQSAIRKEPCCEIKKISAVTPEADLGILFLHNEGYSIMCGHGIIGNRFSGKIIQETTFGPYAAIILQIDGTAHITGRHEFLIDPDDPLKEGFILR